MAKRRHTPLRPLSQAGQIVDDDSPAMGIACPKCGCRHLHVYDTDPRDGDIRRYRVCRNCGRKVTTTERVGV